ncbi:hypothetical protein QR510_27605, partial [Escherichia coli]|nr:hypothetical protein [Escherichia coli]
PAQAGPDRRHGRGARTTRLRRTLSAFSSVRSYTALTQQASIATRATLRDDRASSLVAARAEAVDTANRNSGKEKYFRSGGLTAFAGDLPVGQRWCCRHRTPPALVNSAV